jgi:hypothetical protein
MDCFWLESCEVDVRVRISNKIVAPSPALERPVVTVALHGDRGTVIAKDDLRDFRRWLPASALYLATAVRRTATPGSANSGGLTSLDGDLFPMIFAAVH